MMTGKNGENMPNSTSLRQFLYGREYPIEELPFDRALIEQYTRAGFISVRRGIEKTPGGLFARLAGRSVYRCMRCGNTDPQEFAAIHCSRCGRLCVYCRHCLNMGVIRSCTHLVVWTGPEPPQSHFSASEQLCRWDGRRSAEQEEAAQRLKTSLAAGHSFLIWAVTGAGKTELLFPAIEDLLKRGARLAIATPRTDVVRELYPRLNIAFPTVPIGALYSGSNDRVPGAPLVIATTHQLLRFYHYFNAVVIDEVDAFPFHADPMLPFAVKKAARKNAPIAYLSATPPADLKEAFLKGTLGGVRIAKRYHGRPLPVPRCRWTGNWRRSIDKGILPEPLRRWIHRQYRSGRPLLCFVPSVGMAAAVAGLFRAEKIGPVAGVHAEDPQRHAKVSCFRNGQLRVLVTTTILERGVTVPRVDVVVFGADDPLFDERALVQIAGRVGRSPKTSAGEVVFFHNGRTLEMLRARRHIETMNREGGF
ncbi:MAG: DEAD/DEAH box helicase family protein [Sporolactobacillus sp.]|jgi:competence protein ComFA|nr:DEAD/DEAH box helicase family protein [Sporolactobacillus sp.]